MDFQRSVTFLLSLCIILLSITSHARSFNLRVKYVDVKGEGARSYYYNGEYYNYFHDGRYYNYIHNGKYYRYFVDGKFYNYYFEGEYFQTCASETGYWQSGQWIGPAAACQ